MSSVKGRVRVESKDPQNGGAEMKEEKPMWAQVLGYIVLAVKCLYSGLILAFSIAILMTADESGRKLKGPGAKVLFWVLIVWLAFLEGGQNALVGLQGVDKDLYKSQRWSHWCTTLAHKDNNMERFIVGRQLLVVVVVFVLSLTCTFDKGVCSASFGMSKTLESIFCDTGVASIFTTLLLGQLTSQIVSATNMLVLLNNVIMPVTIVLSLLIEYSGLLHCVYLVQILFNKLTGKKGDKEEEKSTVDKVFFWARVFMSLTFLAFAFAIHLSEIGKGRTSMYKGVPAPVSIVIFFLLMIVVGHLEGMQIAIFAVMRMDASVSRTKVAQLCCDIAFKGENLRKIVVGRQILATVCMFVIARITSVDSKLPAFEIDGETSANVGDGLQQLVNTNLLAALITTIVASLSFRVIASQLPMVFLSNPFLIVILRVCLFLEFTGIMEFAWLLAQMTKKLMRLQPDEEYFAEERKVKNKNAGANQL